MAAEQRHDLGAVLRDGDDRRLVALVGKERREHADQNAGGADADDRAAGGEEAVEVGSKVVETPRFGEGRAAEFSRKVHLSSDRRLRPARRFHPGSGQRDEDRAHRAPPFEMRTIEKYGATSSPNSAKAMTRSSARPACAT
jgi:hypothetical protein